MTRYRGNPPPRGTTPSDPVETYGYLAEMQDRAKAGWVLDTATLYATLAFCSGDIAVDAREYAKDILPHMPTASIKVDAGGLMATPSMQMAVSLAQSCLEYLQSPAGAQATGEAYAAPDDALCRADL